MNYDFEIQNAISLEYENHFIDYLNREKKFLSWDVSKAITVRDDETFRTMDIDIVCETQTEEKIYLDVKADRYISSGNFYFETMSNTKNRERGGCLDYTQSHYWVYWFYDETAEKEDAIYLLPMEETRNWFYSNISNYTNNIKTVVTTRNGNYCYTSKGFTVPIEDVCNAVNVVKLDSNNILLEKRMSYKEYVDPYFTKFTTIHIPEEKVIKIENFVNEIIKVKRLEHKHDNRNEFKRFQTGVSGEVAVELLLGREFVDWTIGDSVNYMDADLKRLGLNIGIKTAEYGNFPVISKTVTRPEIIALYDRCGHKVHICGFAPKDVLERYQTNSVIKSPLLKLKGTKTGFYGFKQLVPFSTIADLKSFVK